MELYQHQKEALKQTEGLNHVAYYLDMGLGKTFVGAEKMIQLDSKVNLLICQKSKVQDWVDHFRMNYSYISEFTYDLTDKRQFEAFIDHAKCDEENTEDCFGIINYDLVWRRQDLLSLKDFTLMLDESSLIQNHGTKRTRFILRMQPANVILLSGTPVGGKYENLWSQCHLLGWKISEELYHMQYVNWKLTEDDGSGIRHKIVNKDDPYKNVDRLKQKLREHGAIFMKTEEVFDLPSQNMVKVKVDKSKEYTKFMKNSVVVFQDKGWTDEKLELVGDTQLVKMLYARQLCGQYSEAKLNAFQDLLQSTQERLVVFYSFNEELNRLKTVCQMNRRPTSEVNGHRKDLTAYEEEPDSVTLVQYQAGAKGLNLQKCNRIIYFTLPLSSDDFEQSKKRIHRIGQERTCFYYLMICKGSIEERILQTLEERKDFTDELFENC